MKRQPIHLIHMLAVALLVTVSHSLHASQSAVDKGAEAPPAQSLGHNEASKIAKIVSASETPNFRWRRRALHALSPSLLESGAQQWLVFLKKGQCPAGWQMDDFLALKNDIIDLLIKHEMCLNELTQLALTVIDDAGEYIVWRDYCVQKLSDLVISGQLSSGSERAAASRLALLAAGEAPGLTGTALISSIQLIKDLDTHPPVAAVLDKDKLADYAFGCASNKAEPYIDRITALQIAAGFKHSRTASYARSILISQDSDVPVMFTVSAIAALGILGDPSDSVYLNPYRNSPDVRIRTAARTSMSRINHTATN